MNTPKKIKYKNQTYRLVENRKRLKEAKDNYIDVSIPYTISKLYFDTYEDSYVDFESLNNFMNKLTDDQAQLLANLILSSAYEDGDFGEDFDWYNSVSSIKVIENRPMRELGGDGEIKVRIYGVSEEDFKMGLSDIRIDDFSDYEDLFAETGFIIEISADVDWAGGN